LHPVDCARPVRLNAPYRVGVVTGVRRGFKGERSTAEYVPGIFEDVANRFISFARVCLTLLSF